MDTCQSRRHLMKVTAGVAAVGFGAGPDRHVNGLVSAIEPDGIGMPRVKWEEEFGEGTPLQMLVEYENARSDVPGSPVYVRYRDQMVVHIELNWSHATQLGGIPVDDAADDVFALLPADAVFIETFDMPASPDGPIGLQAERHESEVLDNLVGSGSILVVYQTKRAETNAGSEPVTVIPAVTLTVSVPGDEA